MELNIRMLGTFSLTMGDQKIDDNENRSRKVWLLLAYTICRRREAVSQEDLIRLLWGEDEEGSANPANALKTMFHRVRALLNQLSPDAGHDLILRRGGSYAWNPDIPLTVDAEEFEALCREGAAEEDRGRKLALYRRAIDLYGGISSPSCRRRAGWSPPPPIATTGTSGW